MYFKIPDVETKMVSRAKVSSMKPPQLIAYIEKMIHCITNFQMFYVQMGKCGYLINKELICMACYGSTIVQSI